MIEVTIEAVCESCGEDVSVDIATDGTIWAGWGHTCHSREDSDTLVGWITPSSIELQESCYDVSLNWGGEA